MNKNFILLGVVGLIVVLGFGYREIFLKDQLCQAGQGEDITIDVRSVENVWEFDPADLTLNKCDRITLNIYNEDDYDHGFAIDVFGVNQRLNPMTTTVITFTASKTGQFVSYCSVPCGDGHFRHTGTVTVVEPLADVHVDEPGAADDHHDGDTQ